MDNLLTHTAPVTLVVPGHSFVFKFYVCSSVKIYLLSINAGVSSIIPPSDLVICDDYIHGAGNQEPESRL